MTIDERMRSGEPLRISVDIRHLAEGDKQAIAECVEAARIIDEIYFDQIAPGNLSLLKALRERKIKIFPVIENGSLAGLVAETDIIQATRDFTRFHQISQEIILSVFGLATAFFLFYFSPIFR